jgi:phenylpropionate dioxygenase-like ring-hydroxylating dioxygenase large terminal subunit
MLSAEDNELLCRVGGRTPMGALLRQYWIPALTSSELPAPDGPQIRVRLLGEDLIAFRATSGRIGLLQARCPHRGAPLFLGRNEADGLRCAYHGWKFDCSGACVDMPNEPADSRFQDKVRAVAYPCVERNGVVWTYMGPRNPPPPLPALRANEQTTPDEPLRIIRDCNWVQALEGDLDSSHLAFAHRRLDFEPDGLGRYLLQKPPTYELEITDFGLTCGARYEAEADSYYWRITHFLFPFYAMVGAGDLGDEIVVRAWVPLDDEHTMFWQLPSRYRSHRPGDTTSGLKGGRFEFQPPTSDPLSRFRLVANASNDYLVDRDFQRSGSFTGMRAPAPVEDQALTEGMGPIYDRTQEHLGRSDIAIIATRRRLLDACRRLGADGTAPPGVDRPEVYRARSGGIVLPRSAHWLEATRDLR